MKPVDEQTILITGSTDGIGKLTAQKLAEKGANVLLHGRNPEKVTRVADEIRASSGNDNIEEYIADFAALKNVRSLADDVLSYHDSLDVLINNAGIGFSDTRQTSEDGYELRFAVNYLSHFLLTHLLLPALQNGAPSRIVNVSSAGQHPIDFDDVMLEKHYDSSRAYSQSKLALILFTKELSEKLEDHDITVNTLHPGTYLNTKMVREAGIDPWGKVETGAEVVTYIATAEELGEISGQYFNQKKTAKANAQAYDAEARKKLWKLSKQYTGIEDY